MRTLIIILLFTFHSFFTLSAQTVIADKVVAVVGSEQVLYSDVVTQAEQLREQYAAQNYTSPRPPMAEALELLLTQKLLYTRAQIDSIGLENLAPRIASTVEQTVQAMVDEAGGIAALQAKEGKPLYAIKDEATNDLEEYYGAQEMRSWLQNKVTVTPGEVDRFYRRIDPDSLPIVAEQYVYAQITKLPDNTELAKQRARERLLELRQRIIDGERFDRLAMMYSVDGGSAMNGGEYEGPAEQWHPPFAEALKKLAIDQVSGVVETESGFHIIQLLEKPRDNFYRFRHILIKPTYTDTELTGALKYLDSLATVIRKGEITFSEAALKYSDDETSKQNGGVVTNQQALFRYTGNSDPKQTRTRFVRDALEQQDAQQLVRLKEGEISRAFLGRDFNMDEMGKILKLVEVIPAHRADLSQDWLDVEAMALARKQENYYNTWLDGKIDEMYVRIDPMFSAGDFENRRWFK